MKFINIDSAPKAVGTYSQAVINNNILYISGQIAINPKTQKLISADIEQQVIQIFNNIKNICTEANTDLSHLIKLSVFMVDLKQFAAVNQIMTTILDSPYPARETVEVSKLPLNAEIEVSAIVHIESR